MKTIRTKIASEPGEYRDPQDPEERREPQQPENHAHQRTTSRTTRGISWVRAATYPT